MKIRELFKDYQTTDLSVPVNLIPDWDKIKSIPEFAALETTHQNTDFHKEGNVWEHTKLVGEAMYDILNDRKYKYKHNLHFPADNVHMANMCLVAAAICHDLGKAGHTKFDEKDQQWHCARHGFHGEQIVRDMFYDENPLVRETVCALVKSHMIFHHLLDEGKEDKVADKLISLSWSNVPISMHILIHLADLHGTVNDDTTPDKIRKYLNKILSVCYQYNVPFDHQYEFTNLKYIFTRYRNFLNSGETIPEETLIIGDIEKPLLHMMIGLPGSGKDTYIRDVMKAYDNPEKYTILCRDDIRVEIGITKPGEKKSGSKTEEQRVNEIFNERFNKAISEKKEIIINNTNLPKKYREAYLVPGLSGGYKTVYHIIEAPDMREAIARRAGQIPLKAIRYMKESYEFPTLRETNKIIIHKQMFDENNDIVVKDYTITNYLPANEDFLES